MKKICFFTAIFLLALFTASCMPDYQKTFWDEGDKHGWTEKQKETAWAFADQIYWSHQVNEDKQQYVIMYNRVPTSRVREQLEMVLKDFDATLDPKNGEMVQYLGTFNLRKDLEHEESVTQAIYTRVRAEELSHQFDQLMNGTTDDEVDSLSGGYSAKKIFVNKKLADAFPFKSDQIEAARQDGLLKPIEHLELDYSSSLDHKDLNPVNPDDTNDFVWKSKKQSIRLTEYKIIDVDKPEDNKGDYIEGYRVFDGQQEPSPALRIFFPSSGTMSVILLDTDQPGQPGYGVPDILEQAFDLEHVQDIIKDGSLLDAMFVNNDKKKDRIVPETRLFKVEIAHLGDPINPWDTAPNSEGWVIPFKYKSEQGDNYNVRFHYKHPKMEDHMKSDFMILDYVEKEYIKSGSRYEPSEGQVIEYYHPKDQFAGNVKAKVLYDDDTKKVSFEFEDGSVVEGFVTPGANKFIEDRPYAKSYNEGQKRWWIESSDGGKKFDKRKLVGPPKESTGEYDDDGPTFTPLNSNNGGGMEMLQKHR